METISITKTSPGYMRIDGSIELKDVTVRTSAEVHTCDSMLEAQALLWEKVAEIAARQAAGIRRVQTQH